MPAAANPRVKSSSANRCAIRLSHTARTRVCSWAGSSSYRPAAALPATGGGVAFGQLAHEQAARLYPAALELGGTSLGDHDRFRLLLAAGASCHRQGDLGGRLDACLDAAEIARRLDRPDLLAQTALVMAATGLPGFDLPTRRLCREALSLMGDESSVSPTSSGTTRCPRRS